MRDKYKVVFNPTFEELRTALLLDRQAFKQERCAKYSVCRYWMKKNPESFIVLKYEERIIGYICFMPLTKSAFRKYENGEMHEYNLRSKDIEKYVSGQEYDCLFCCINIDKEFHDGEAIIRLMDGYETLQRSLRKRKITIKNIIADCITKHGEKFAKRMGFIQLKKLPDGVLYIKKEQ